MIAVRHLETIAEFEAAVRLQKEIWGFNELELLPVRLFVVATKVGGQAIGAFDADTMVGFLLAIPGLKQDGATYLHSHMMGVVDGYRNVGVGRLLKLAQREEALARGVTLVEWTFDPLAIKNAYFNLERLGAVVRRYVLNQYGTTTSPLHGGLPTDRCVAEWYLDSVRVRDILAREPVEHAPVRERIPVPAAIDRIRKEQPRQAREIQEQIGNRFLECFEQGLAATGFERTAEQGVYLLSSWDSK
jgi:predicted GNAT superfamily acetyltransferase